MTVELGNLIVASATLLVIAATAYAALGQLRHMNTTNQLNSLLFVLKLSKDPVLRAHLDFFRNDYPVLATEPQFMRDYEHGPLDREVHRELYVFNWYEEIGALLKHRLMDENAFLDMVCPAVVLRDWTVAAPAIAIMRAGSPVGAGLYQNFEFLAARSKRLMDREPDGIYPSDTPRLTLPAPSNRPVLS